MSLAFPPLPVSQIQDPYIRKNFENLAAYFRSQNQLLDFKFFEASFTTAETGVKLAHGLPLAPLDILITRCTGAGTVTFRHGEFDATHLVLDVSGACRVRFFAGTYAGQTSSLSTESDDQMEFSSAPPAATLPPLHTQALPLTSAEIASGDFPGSSENIYLVKAVDEVLEVTTSVQSQTVKLLPAADTLGQLLYVKKVSTGANTVTVTPNGSETVDGAATLVLSASLAHALLYSDGSNYVRMDS